MTQRRKSKKDQKIDFLQEQINNNVVAFKDGPKKKNWSRHDLKSIKPITETQRCFFESYYTGNNIIASGSAGSGKTYVAIYLALSSLLEENSPYKRLILVRSATATKSQGFLPGSLEDKQAPFETPFKDIFDDLLKYRHSYDSMKDCGLVQFYSSSYIRGLNWDNAIVIVDECQSATFHELDSIITRIGKNSKLIMCGDTKQNDLIYNKYEQSGMKQLLEIANKVPEFDVINFTTNDIVRSGFVRSWLMGKEDCGY